MGSRVNNVNLIGDILTEKEFSYLMGQIAVPGAEVLHYQLWPAAEEGIKGFVGDHFKVVISVKESECVRYIHLFIKTLPFANKPKADFITKNHFFKREALLFKLFEEMSPRNCNYGNSWCAKSLVHNDKVLVMPDLCVQGYRTYPAQHYLDKKHVTVAVTAIAGFHAGSANYITNKSASKDHAYDFLNEHGDIVKESTFCESPWLRAAAKLHNNFLREFSSKSHQYPEDLENKLWEMYIKACESLKQYDDTLNVIVHKDLWANNIMFQYKGDEITNAVLLDFQCVRYGPPAFDVMLFLYLTTSRNFRDRHEREVLHCYYEVFSENLDDLTGKRLKELKYDEDAFLVWCEKARMFGMLVAIAIFPYVLLEPSVGQKMFDDPETYVEYLEEDRSAPVIAHARDNLLYRNRQLEVYEEFVEKYVM